MLALTLAWLFYYQRQQHRSHRLLAAEYSLRRAMSESAVVGLRVTDREGRIIYVNETFQKILGCEASDLLGQRPPYTYWLEDIHERLDGILKPETHARTRHVPRTTQVGRSLSRRSASLAP